MNLRWPQLRRQRMAGEVGVVVLEQVFVQKRTRVSRGGFIPTWWGPGGRCPAARPAERGKQRCPGRLQTCRWSFMFPES